MRFSALALAALLALPLASCDEAEGGPDEYVTDCESNSGTGAVTSDESYTAFVNAAAAGSVKKDNCKSPDLTSPAAGATLDPNAPPQVAFSATHASCALRRRALPLQQYGLCEQPAPLWERALDTVLLVSTAHAHCAAITGENYLLQLTGADGKPVYAAMLSVTSYTPDAAKWKKALSAHAGETLTLTIQRGVFLKGDLDEGPYVQPQGWTFSVAK